MIREASKKHLNEWERTFVTTLKERKNGLTPKQREILNRILGIKAVTPLPKPNSKGVVVLPLGIPEGVQVTQRITTREYRKNRNKTTQYDIRP